MNTIAKKRVGVIFGTLAFLVFAALVVCLPRTSYAAALGTESPNVYCTYTDSNGKQYDGDKLPAGTYDVSFYLEGVTELSVVQVTSTYSSDVSVQSEPKALLSEEVTDVSSMGTVTNDSNLVFGFVSDADTCSSVTKDGTLLATFSVTFAKDCDAADVISVSTDPNKTFIMVNYNDGFGNEYALVTESADYPGSLYLMTCDVSPKASGYDITGQVKIATDLTGTEVSAGIANINLTVESADGSAIATATTDSNGEYTLSGVPAGEYTMLISGETTVDRKVTLVVSESKDVGSVGVVICDYNKDELINGTDYMTFISAYTGDYNLYCDFNGDNIVNGTDYMSFIAFYNKTVNYNSVTLK